MIRSFIDHLFVGFLSLLPHHLLSQGVHGLTRIQWPWLKNVLIGQFIRHFNVDMTLAVVENPTAFPDFNAFFTRAIKPEARPLAAGQTTIICPVDGAVSQAGLINRGRVFQAKGHDFGLDALLGGDENLARLFTNGCFATLYLSPRDYHRIHMPLGGYLEEMIYIPGRLHSVNERSARCIPGLFARNERVVTLFDTEAGPMALVLVGALFVSSIDTVWEKQICSTNRILRRWDYRNSESGRLRLERGDEMGRFNMGSTVIALFDSARVSLSDQIQPSTAVNMGQSLATIKQP